MSGFKTSQKKNIVNDLFLRKEVLSIFRKNLNTFSVLTPIKQKNYFPEIKYKIIHKIW